MGNLESSAALRAALIYNPVARGLARHRQALERALVSLQRHGIHAALVPTTGPGTAGAQARSQIDAGRNLIIAAGGDGTINEVASGMLHTDVPLAILPGGTANVLARELRIPLNLEKAAAAIPEMKAECVAVGVMRSPGTPDRPFLCMAGAGLDADIVSRLDLDFKARAGKLAYYVTGFSQVFRSLPEFEVVVDGKQHRASFALISRVRNYGGDLEIARRASLLRNDFELVLFRGVLSLRYIPYLMGAALGQAHRVPGCTVLRAQSVRCNSSSGALIRIQVDGELAGALPMNFAVIPNALNLLLPESTIAREKRYLPASA